MAGTFKHACTAVIKRQDLKRRADQGNFGCNKKKNSFNAYLTPSFHDIIYRWVLCNPDYQLQQQREWFELVCVFCGRRYGQVPITFLIGFYVSEVVRRYWDQFMSLPFTDRLALKLVTFVPGKDTFPRHLRRAVMRYVNLSIVLVFRLVSTKVHSR